MHERSLAEYLAQGSVMLTIAIICQECHYYYQIYFIHAAIALQPGFTGL